MIVKVQLSIITNIGCRQMLIYDKSREYYYEADATKEVLKLMSGRNKAYFEAELIPDPKTKGETKIIQITEEAPTQDW